MKKNLGLWIIIVVILVGGLTFIGFMVKNQNKGYKELEAKMEDTAQGYFGEYINKLRNGATVSSKELLDYHADFKMDVEGDQCTGYVKTTSKMGIYEYKAYIKCNNYTTTDYTVTECNGGC